MRERTMQPLALGRARMRQPKAPQLQRNEFQPDEPPARTVQGHAAQVPEVGALPAMRRDAFVVFDQVAAAVQHELAGVNRRGLRAAQGRNSPRQRDWRSG